MKKILAIIKYIINSALITLLCLYAGLYVLLSIPVVQQQIKDVGTKELSALLGTPLSIDRISIHPFNKIALHDVILLDKNKKSLLHANKIMAGVELLPLLKNKLVITNAQLFGFEINITRKNTKSEFNFQFLIDALKPKKRTETSQIDFQINSILIRRGNLCYDVLSEKRKEKGVFDSHHIRINNFISTLSLKSLQKDSVNIFVKRLSFDEQAGFKLKRLSFRVMSNSQKASIDNLQIVTPNSKLHFAEIDADVSRTHSIDQFCDSAQLHLKLNNGKIAFSDLASFVPILRNAKESILLSCDIQGTVNSLQVRSLVFNYANNGVRMNVNGNIDGVTQLKNAYLYGKVQHLAISQKGIAALLSDLSLQEKVPTDILQRLGNIYFLGNISGFLSNLVAYGQLNTAQGTIHSDLLISQNIEKKAFELSGNIETRNFKIGKLLGQEEQKLGSVSLKLNLDIKQSQGRAGEGKLDGEIRHIDYNKYPFENIKLKGKYIGLNYDGVVEIDDPNGYLRIEGIADIESKIPSFKLNAKGKSIHLNELYVTPKYANSSLSFDMNANFSGSHFDNADGIISVDSLSFANNGDTLQVKDFTIHANNSTMPQHIKIDSDILSGEITGKYSFATLPISVKEMLSDIFPSMIKKGKVSSTKRFYNYFNFDLSAKNTETLSKVLEWPVLLSKPATLSGSFSDEHRLLRIDSHFPEISFGGMKIEGGNFSMEKKEDKMRLAIHGNMINAKQKYILLALSANAQNDQLETKINWSNIGNATYCGELSSTTRFRGTEVKSPDVEIKINPSNIIINDTTWRVAPALVSIDSGKIDISNFEIRHDNQFIRLAGQTSKNPNDELMLRLQDISLNYIFETLNINYVTFGGQATGDFTIINLFKTPIINTDNFFVKDFSYNSSIMGDLKLHSKWDNTNQGILLQGGISRKNMKDTGIDGYIFPTKDSLYIAFDANHLNLSFIRPFTDKVLKNLRGEASGKVLFYGKFRALNVVGDVKTNNFAFDVEYTNTSYLISDSVKFTTSSISFKDLTIFDQNRNMAKATGILYHNSFRNLRYNINVNNAYNFLMFNIPNTPGAAYYGTVFASGNASFRGDLVKTAINVNVRTNEHSKFTYVLPTNRTANEYQFITFVDKKQKYNKQRLEMGEPTEIAPPETNDLTINLQIDATPNATMQLVMDPTSGDVIKANGNGAMRIVYNNKSDFKIYGTYTVEKGSYNFSLQDLFMRDFGIKSGSNITFRGEPMTAELDIEGTYSLTANLRDLDESFVQEKELNRTNVPVQTVLSVAGDLQRPDLKFDIQFPTLSQDMDRRVRSIISSDDMMNRQIIYLLALGKFYTPDYMNTGQRNDLASVASSTLSSQLNNILGQISDKWNIGTNIRSDKGDFSDVEVELALSSQLLNNRLIFNGNFGYRDNAMNNNNFIGDFDLEYLLNKSGNLRLKAYNHYNDKNFYIKSALTTQGVGLVFKRDFTKFSDLFIKAERLKKDREQKDSISSAPGDSISFKKPAKRK